MDMALVGPINPGVTPWENAMRSFLKKHEEKIAGFISSFDRVLFKGYLPLGWPEALECLLYKNGLLIKDFKRFVSKHSNRLKEHAKATAEQAGRPYSHLEFRIRKDDEAQAIAQRDGITDGLVCVFSAMESGMSFKVKYGKKRPKIVRAERKCLCLYFYFIDRDFGLLHVRIQTWFPFTVQICLNAHEYLARRMDNKGIQYSRQDNAFLWIEDTRRAQRLANSFFRRNWVRFLSRYARRVNPLMDDLLQGKQYYWITEQAEFATDIMFQDHPSLKPLYEKLLEHAIVCFSPEDVLTFLGRKLHGNFAGEVLGDFKKRWPGARIKHRMKKNWIKMYDKHGCVLRIETVINHPYEFKIRRKGIRNGEEITDWFPMPKGVAFIDRYAQISLAVNQRYLEALSVVDDPQLHCECLHHLAKPLHVAGRAYKGFNPASPDDIALFKATLSGDNFLSGFRNKDIRRNLFPGRHTLQEKRRLSARVSRLFKRLHVRGLIAKIPRSRRWRVTTKGHLTLSTALHFYNLNPGYQCVASTS
jgi:hypothetical protein